MRLLLTFLLLVTSQFMLSAHPLKMAYTAVKYNPQKQVFEISHRVFQDDFELTLQTKYNYSGGDVFINQRSAVTQVTLNWFFDQNFSIQFNGNKPKLHFKSMEQKNQMGIIVTYETERISLSNLKSISIYNYIMMEIFKEQVNMFNLNINDEIKRTLKFELGKTNEIIAL